MSRIAGQKDTAVRLYPPIKPYDERMLDVGDGHRLYVEQSGNPDGMPVVVLHGGPGGGCSPVMRSFFDPAVYRIILFDQRGCGRSRPFASVEANTTWHLVADIEQIREELCIDRWVVFGGSWGATLALIYAISHPDRAAYLVLRGVFMMTRAELDWFYGGGAAAFWPDLWQNFINPIPTDERGNVIEAYHRRLFSGDLARERRFGQAWAGWENALASASGNGATSAGAADYARAFARIENHYFFHSGFLECDGWILREIGAISHIGASIVQGRLDMICPPTTAWQLSQAWPRADLKFVPLSGHALSEPKIGSELLSVTNALRHLRAVLRL